MTVALDADFLRLPIAHRGLHGPGVPENSLAAFRAAISAGYGIELDVQHAADGEPMVFHDYDLIRMAGCEGYIADASRDELARMRLGKTDESIPTLAEVVRLVAGQVPLLVEIKDQDGRLGENIGELQDRVASMLAPYRGPVAVMSFNPHTVAAFTRASDRTPAGLVACAFDEDDWPMLEPEDRGRLAALAGFEGAGAVFVAHDHRDLANPALHALRAKGVPVLSWTIRSPEEEALARAMSDNITFERYTPVLP